jgi:hypothetical protein
LFKEVRMNDAMIATYLRNLDLRLASMEQMLPTLATKEELKALATKEDLREEGERFRRYMDVLSEALRADIRLLAEHLSVVVSKVARLP